MPEHQRASSLPRWVALSVFVVVMVAVFVMLGRWQLHRADSQTAEDTRKTAALAAAPVDVADLLAPGQAMTAEQEWRAVTATGTYDAAHQLLVRNRTLDSANGYLVLVPLRTAGGDVPVVRGWIPAGPTAEAPATLPAVPSGTVTVTGRVRPAEPGTLRTDLPTGQVERIMPTALAQLTGRPTYDGWVSMLAEDPAPGAAATLRTLPADGSSGWTWPISHTVYAMQWFTFGVIAVVGWFVLLRRDVRESAPAPGPSSRAADPTTTVPRA